MSDQMDLWIGGEKRGVITIEGSTAAKRIVNRNAIVDALDEVGGLRGVREALSDLSDAIDDLAETKVEIVDK